jgi:hypothetical protein
LFAAAVGTLPRIERHAHRVKRDRVSLSAHHLAPQKSV